MSYASSSPEIFEQINYLNLVNLYDDITYLSKILEKQIFAQLMEKISSFGSEKLEQIKNSNQFIHKRLLEPTVIIANHVQVITFHITRTHGLDFWNFSENHQMTP